MSRISQLVITLHSIYITEVFYLESFPYICDIFPNTPYLC